MEVSGQIKVINKEETFGSSGFRKRELVVTTNEQYPQMLMIEFVQDKCDLLDKYQVGQNVKVAINLRGREWINPEGVAKYFNSIQGWRIEAIAGGNSAKVDEMPPLEDMKDSNEPDDLPF
jgi:hypothetical protein